MKSRSLIEASMFAVLFISSTFPMSSAAARDVCRNTLTNGFFDEYSASSASLRDRAMYAELCSRNFPEARAAIKRALQFGDDGSLGVSYGLFSPRGSELGNLGPGSGANAADGLEEDRFRQWKSAYCSKNSAKASSDAAEFFMQKAATGRARSMVPAVSAWSACMRMRAGLTCWAAPHGIQNEEFVLNVNWTQPGPFPSQVQRQFKSRVLHSFLTRGAAAQFEDAAPQRLLPAGHELDAGTLKIPVTRPMEKAINANLKVGYEEKEYSCNVFIPGERDFALTTPFPSR